MKFLKSNLSAIIIGLILFTSSAFALNAGYALLDSNGEVLNGSGEFASLTNTIIVKSEDDLPALNGSNQHPLAVDTTYQFDGYVTIANPLLFPAAGNTSIIGNSFVDTINYTGANTMLLNPTLGAYTQAVSNVTLLGNGTATLFDFASTNESSTVALLGAVIVGFADLGDIAGVGSVTIHLTPIFDPGVGLTISGFNDCLVDTSVQTTVTAGAVTFFDIDMDEDAILSVLDNTVELKSGDSLLNITTSASDWRAVIQSNAITPTSSSLFKAGSLDQTDKRISAKLNPGFADSATKASMFMITNATLTSIATQDVPLKAGGTWTTGTVERFTFNSNGRLTYTGLEDIERQVTVNLRGLNDAGVNKDFSFYISKGNDTNNTITAFADSAADPGVDTTVTSAAHGLSAGDRVPITNTTNYNLVHTVTRVVDANNFDIDFVYVANDATGNWALIDENSLSGNRFSTTDNKNTTVIATTVFSTNDYVEFFIENNTDATDFALDQTKFIIR